MVQREAGVKTCVGGVEIYKVNSICAKGCLRERTKEHTTKQATEAKHSVARANLRARKNKKLGLARMGIEPMTLALLAPRSTD